MGLELSVKRFSLEARRCAARRASGFELSVSSFTSLVLSFVREALVTFLRFLWKSTPLMSDISQRVAVRLSSTIRC